VTESLTNSMRSTSTLNIPLGIAIVCGNLGVVYRLRGDLDLAEKAHRRSLEIDQQLGHQEERLFSAVISVAFIS
jgi:hypothetical protein